MLIEDAPADNVILASRAIRPYPPGNLQVDAQSYPTAVEFDYSNVITWAHRDRLQQTGAYIYDYTYGNIGPEAGTTYRIVLQAIAGNLDVTALGQDTTAATTYTFTGADSNFAAMPVTTEFVTIDVYSVRDGYDSWQPATITLPVVYDSTPSSGGKFLVEIITLTSAGEFDFDGIPGGYARIIIEGTIRTTDSGANEFAQIFFNSDTTSSNYHEQAFRGTGGTTVGGRDAVNCLIAQIPSTASPADTVSTIQCVIEGYDDTAIIKGVVTNYGCAVASTTDMTTGISFISHHTMTDAITRIRIRDDDHPTFGLTGTLHIYGEY